MRLIDADRLIAELQKDEECFDKEAEDAKDDPSYTEGYSDAMWSRANGIRDAIIEIHTAPTIDAVEVVRCGECRHKYMKDFDMFCPHMVGIIKPNMHCSYGERREP